MPDAKPLSAEEVRLGSPNYQPTANRTSAGHGGEEDDEQTDGPFNSRRIVVEKDSPQKMEHPTVVLAAAAPLMEATSPARQPKAAVLQVCNLVRPFTINQLKELLARTGQLVEGKFWIDKVKSSCLVQVIVLLCFSWHLFTFTESARVLFL